MNTALEYSTRVVQEGGHRCKKSTLNDLVHLTPLRISLMNPPIASVEGGGHAAPLFACQSAQKDGCAQRTGAHARPEPTSYLDCLRAI